MGPPVRPVPFISSRHNYSHNGRRIASEARANVPSVTDPVVALREFAANFRLTKCQIAGQKKFGM
jgi:hypothetical protein